MLGCLTWELDFALVLLQWYLGCFDGCTNWALGAPSLGLEASRPYENSGGLQQVWEAVGLRQNPSFPAPSVLFSSVCFCVGLIMYIKG